MDRCKLLSFVSLNAKSERFKLSCVRGDVFALKVGCIVKKSAVGRSLLLSFWFWVWWWCGSMRSAAIGFELR